MNHFHTALEKLGTNFATRGIPTKLQGEGFNEALAKEICSVTHTLSGSDVAYDTILTHFIDFSVEFLKLQAELEQTGEYHFGSFQETQDEVYQNPEVMETTYLNGLLLSQALWINHNKIFTFFSQTICQDERETGKVIEVPVGTGIFLSEFLKHNPEWTADGFDISPSAVKYSQKVLDIRNPSHTANLAVRNVFDIPEEGQYDTIICGLLLENLEQPRDLLKKLQGMLAQDGRIFMTASAWASTIDHIYVFKSVQEIKDMMSEYFDIEKDLALNVFEGKLPTDEKTPINYACILKHTTSP